MRIWKSVSCIFVETFLHYDKEFRNKFKLPISSNLNVCKYWKTLMFRKALLSLTGFSFYWRFCLPLYFLMYMIRSKHNLPCCDYFFAICEFSQVRSSTLISENFFQLNQINLCLIHQYLKTNLGNMYGIENIVVVNMLQTMLLRNSVVLTNTCF